MKKNTTEYLVAMALDEEKRISEATGEPLKPYEINVLAETKEGRKRIVTVKRVETIEATSLAHAHDISKHFDIKGCKTRVFPKVDVMDGESLMNFGRYIVRQYENWERRNDYAVMNLRDRTPEQREAMVSDAIDGVLNQYRNGEDTDVVYNLWKKGMDTVATEQKRKERRSSVELDQEAVLTGRIEPRKDPEHQTCPEMSALVSRAYRSGCLSIEQQRALVLAKVGGMSASDVADMMNVNRQTIYKLLVKAERNLLKWMIENDEADAMGLYGLSVYDVEELVKTLENKAKGRKGKK